MAISTFGAIHIGASELSMKIYEFHQGKELTTLSHVRRKLSLSAKTYTKGTISFQSVSDLCQSLRDFKRILSEFQVSDYRLYVSSDLKEASNFYIILDQIKIQTGFHADVLSNSETRFLYYKALFLKEKDFEKTIQKATLAVDVDAGSLQLSVFADHELKATQNLHLGSARIQQLLHIMENEAYNFPALIDEYIEKNLVSFTKLYLKNFAIEHIVVFGQMIPTLYYLIQDTDPSFEGTLSKKALVKEALIKDLLKEQARFVVPTLLLVRKIASLTNCNNVVLSPIDILDGIAANYGEKKKKVVLNHDFITDILSSAHYIAGKYMVDRQHTDVVANLALQIFDKIRKLHGLGKRQRLLLQLGVILHSCGSYISEVQRRECSYQIIMSTEIIGISHKERSMVANMVRYNSLSFPAYEQFQSEFSTEEYLTIIKLNAILTIANVLDSSNRHKIPNVSISLKDDTLQITADTMADITLEKGLFHSRADIFEEVFGIRPELRQKRSGR